METVENVRIKIKKPEMEIEGSLRINEDSNGQKKYVRFVGIPYAKPPTENRRFQPPEPYEYDAARDGDPFVADTEMPSATQMNKEGCILGQEDCLYLSVYMPKRPEDIPTLLPVLVYFHGGGFFMGSGSYEFRTPDSMLMHDLLFVSVNYRLGPFGFLNMRTPECKGNAGLKDQVMALQWVQDNIEAFRGNANNVTICGESAGGTCVNFHLISPLSRNLFNKAIVISGGIYCPWGFTGHQRNLMKHFMMHHDPRTVYREEVALDLIKADAEYVMCLDHEIRNTEMSEFDLNVHIGPSSEKEAEGAFLPPNFSIDDLMRLAKPVPILAGINAEEGADVLMSGIYHQHHLDLVKNDVYFQRFLMVNLHWDEEVALRNVSTIRKMYYGDRMHTMDELEVQKCLADLCTDLWFHRFYDNFKLGDGEESAPLFVYKFNFISELNPSWLYRKIVTGAAHGDELPYLFCPGSVKKRQELIMTDETRQKVKSMCSLWASFCETGFPRSVCHDVEWLPHTDEEPRYLDISNSTLEMKYERLYQTRWKLLNDIIKKEPRIQSPQVSPVASDRGCFYAFAASRSQMKAAFKQVKLRLSECGRSASQPSPSNLSKRSKDDDDSKASTSSKPASGPSKPTK